MGFIGDLWSIPNTFISAGIASSASKKAFQRQKELMYLQGKLNYDYGQNTLLNSPSSQRQGLEKAGYNPMLAVQNATSGANSGWTSGTGVSQDDYAGIISANATSAQAFNSMDNLNKQTDSNVKLQEAQTRKENAESATSEISNKYLDDKSKKELGKLHAETSKLNRETSYFDALEQNMIQERRLQEMGINLDYRARLYGADKGFAGTVYNANTNERNSIRTNETQRGMRTDKLPFGIGSTYYDMRGKDSRMRANDINDRKYWRNYY